MLKEEKIWGREALKRDRWGMPWTPAHGPAFTPWSPRTFRSSGQWTFQMSYAAGSVSWQFYDHFRLVIRSVCTFIFLLFIPCCQYLGIPHIYFFPNQFPGPSNGRNWVSYKHCQDFTFKWLVQPRALHLGSYVFLVLEKEVNNMV